jgi:hypothetical protein
MSLSYHCDTIARSNIKLQCFNLTIVISLANLIDTCYHCLTNITIVVPFWDHCLNYTCLQCYHCSTIVQITFRSIPLYYQYYHCGTIVLIVSILASFFLPL